MNKHRQQNGEHNVIADAVEQSVINTGDNVNIIVNVAASGKFSVSAERLSSLWRDYSAHLARKVSTVRIFGNEAPHALDQVFVELSINEEYERRPNQAEFMGMMDSELRRMRSVFGDADQLRADDEDPSQRHMRKTKRTLKPDDMLRRTSHAVITGAPGCGKTTLLRYLAWQTLKGWRDSDANRTASVSDLSVADVKVVKLPVYLELKSVAASDFKDSRKRSSKNAVNLLAQLLFDKALTDYFGITGKAERAALQQHFHELLCAGRVAIFLDGLDEVSGASFSPDLQTAVGEFLSSAYGQNTVIISTRPFALRSFSNTKTMEILPLNPRQIEKFIEHYYHEVPERQQFQRELQRRRELCELARVPALLGFILQLWRKQGTVTDDKLELYEQITLELARQLDSEKEGISPDRQWLVEDKDGSLKLDLLRQLAFNQLFKGLIRPPYDIGSTDSDATRLVFTGEQLRDEAITFTRALKEREGLSINPRNLTEDVKATALLRQVGADHYAFAHLTLQEYMAAWQLAKRDNGDTCERIFCRAYFNPTLAEMEVLPMTLGLVGKPDGYYEALEQLPESLDFKGLRIRTKGLQYGAEVTESTIKRLTAELQKFVQDSEPENAGYFELIIDNLSGLKEKQRQLIHSSFVPFLKSKKAKLNAVALIGKVGYNDAVTVISKMLRKREWQIGGVAAKALAEIGTPQASTVLIKAAKSEYATSPEIIFALGAIKDELCFITLEEILLDGRHEMAEYAADALGEIGSDEAAELLLEAVFIGDFDVSWSAAMALKELRYPWTGEVLCDYLEIEENTEGRQYAVTALGGIPSSRVEGVLVQALKEQDVWVRFRAAEALGYTGGKKAVKALIKTLNDKKDKDPSARYAAALSLGQIGDEQAVKHLIVALKDSDTSLRVRAVIGLGEIGGAQAIAALHRCLLDEDKGVRWNATFALAKYGEKRAEEIILQSATDKLDDSELLQVIVKNLERMDRDEAIQKLIEILEGNTDDYIKERVIRALGKRADEKAITSLFSALVSYKSSVSASAAKAIRNFEFKAIANNLQILLENPNDIVLRKAILSIGYYSQEIIIQHKLRELSKVETKKTTRLFSQSEAVKYSKKMQYFNLPVEGLCDSVNHPQSRKKTIPRLKSIIKSKYDLVTSAKKTAEKGRALEDLLAVFFDTFQGFSVIERNYNTATEEIDLVLRNASADPFWREKGSLILVEAKNWQAQRVGKNEYVQFYRKLETRGGHCQLGFLICTERFAETFHLEALRDSKERLRVVPIDGEDLRRLVESTERETVLRELVERSLLT